VTRLLAAAAVVALLGTTAVASDTIRVALAENARVAEFRGVDIEVQELGGCLTCPRRAWRADGVKAVATGQGVEIDGRSAPGFRLTSGTPIRVNGREYPAVLEVIKNGDALAIVNELRLDEYLVGVLRAETGDRWPSEALRAQAIVARTYAAYHRLLNLAKPYHIIASTTHQM